MFLCLAQGVGADDIELHQIAAHGVEAAHQHRQLFQLAAVFHRVGVDADIEHRAVAEVHGIQLGY